MYRDRRRLRAVLMSAARRARRRRVRLGGRRLRRIRPRPRRPRPRRAPPRRRRPRPRPPRPPARQRPPRRRATDLGAGDHHVSREPELGARLGAGARREVRGRDRHPRRLPDHPCRPVLQRPADQARSRRRGHGHLRWPERQDRHPAPARRREERGPPHRRGVGRAHGSAVAGQIRLDGNVYGQTIWDTVGGSWVMVYNKTIFGSQRDQVPTTYEEFAAACTTLSERRGHADLRARLGRLASRAVVPRARARVRGRLARTVRRPQRQRGDVGRRCHHASWR